jgi:hypothetical protein
VDPDRIVPAGPTAGGMLPSLLTFNPLLYYNELASAASSTPTPATMPAAAYYGNVLLPFVLIVGVLYLLEKRRVGARVSAGAKV